MTACFDLLDRETGVLQRRGGEGDKAVRRGGADFRQRLILDADQFRRRVPLGMVPVGIDAERGDVEPLRIHCRDARRGIVHQQFWVFQRVADDRHGVGYRAVGVDVHRLDPRAVDDDLAAMRVRRRDAGLRAVGRGGAAQFAADETDSRWTPAHSHFLPFLAVGTRS